MMVYHFRYGVSMSIKVYPWFIMASVLSWLSIAYRSLSWFMMNLFPTTLCGVLVFYSVSRAPSPPPAPPASLHKNFTHTHKLNIP